MTRGIPTARHSHCQGQILLERALFCVGCELIFTGTSHCPRCASGEAVWPLAEWLHSTRSTTAMAAPQWRSSVDRSQALSQHRTSSAA
jgi:hypothetical protein